MVQAEIITKSAKSILAALAAIGIQVDPEIANAIVTVGLAFYAVLSAIDAITKKRRAEGK
ncbi:MAG: hypothetical protein ACOX5Z_00265 [Desulfobulbus sp.]|jgi:hypothetical protein